jgi:hypothetical protein
MTDSQESSMVELFAKAFRGNLGLRMALMLVKADSYEKNLHDLAEALAEDAVKVMKSAIASKASQ